MLTVHSFVVGYIIGVACGILACRQHLVIILFPSVDCVCVRAVCVCVSVVLCVAPCLDQWDGAGPLLGL